MPEEWNIDEIIRKYDPRVVSQLIVSDHRVKKAAIPDQISYEDLEAAYNVAAKVVAIYGEIYLPIFERLQFELDIFDKKKKLLEKAKKIADDMD